MVWTYSIDLSLTTVEDSVTIRVTYNAVFSEFDRFLAENGLRFEEDIVAVAVDPGPLETTLASFPRLDIPVRAGEGSLTIARDRSLTVPRASLQEDSGLGDDDEILCLVRIVPKDMPSSCSGWTNEVVLEEGLFGGGGPTG